MPRKFNAYQPCKKKCYVTVTLKSFSARKTKSIWIFFNILNLAKTPTQNYPLKSREGEE